MLRLIVTFIAFCAFPVTVSASQPDWNTLNHHEQAIVDLIASDLFAADVARASKTTERDYHKLTRQEKSYYRRRAIDDLHMYKREPRRGEI